MSTFRRTLRRGNDVTRLSFTPALAAFAASLSFAGITSAQPAPPAGVPAAGGAPPPPPAAPAVAGAASAIKGVTPEYVDKPDFAAGRKEGWSPLVHIGGSVSLANNSNVVGQVDGTTFSFGMKLDAGADYNLDKHEWRNSLGLIASVTRTPVIDQFVKTTDNLAFESIYLYHALPWFGPFVRFSANTNMFRGTDVRPTPVQYQIVNADGTAGQVLTTAPTNQMTLSDPFRPLTLKESLGLFVQPYRSDPVTVELRAGAGAQEVLANGQLALSGSQPPMGLPGMTATMAPVPIIYLQQLASANQLGAELAASVWGGVLDKRITYKLDLDAMTPFAHTALAPGDTRSAFALTNVQIDAKVIFHIVEWASLDYQLKAIRQPQVLDAFQVQNTLLLTFGLSYGGKPPAPPPCTPCAAAPAAPPAPGAPPAPAAPPPAPAK